MQLSHLPAFNAVMNSVSFICLLCGWICIRRGDKATHQKFMVGALGASVLFLASYVIYHFNAGRTVFADPAWFRPYYLALLISHTVLAVVIVPLVIMTVHRAVRGDFERHRAIARWTWPLWIYVSATGVLIYLILYQVFPQTRPTRSAPPTHETR